MFLHHTLTLFFEIRAVEEKAYAWQAHILNCSKLCFKHHNERVPSMTQLQHSLTVLHLDTYNTVLQSCTPAFRTLQVVYVPCLRSISSVQTYAG
jgi:hypothetical protein